LIPSRLVELIRSSTSEIESGRRLPADLVEALTDTGIFRAGVPAAIGGGEVDLPEQLETFEELAHADASVGWCATIGAQTSVTSALLEPDVAREIFSDPRMRVGGVLAPSGRAVTDGDSFRLDGRWAFGSGVTHCDWFGLCAVIFEGDAPRMVGERPEARFLFMPTDQIAIEDTWDVSGLRGTGSNHVRAEGVVVPTARSFPLLGAKPFHDGPLYRIPLFGMLAVGLGAVALGVARRALDELDVLAAGKTPTGTLRPLGRRSHVQMERARAEADLRAARELLYATVHEAWVRAVGGDEPTIEKRAGLRLAATNAVKRSAEVVDRAYEAGGGTSIYSTSPLQRCFRDVHTITQHMMVAPATYELAGRVLLGVETDVSQL
jgi:alkylation response protein AidB-like acyl-CoA dehydrogenase